MPRRAALVLSAGVMVLAAWAVAEARAWPWKAALFPLVIGIPVFLLAAAELCLTAWGRGTASTAAAVDFALSAGVEPRVAFRRTGVAFAWTLGFFVLIVAVGFPAAVPLFVGGYLKAGAREGWGRSLALAAGAWGFVYALFIRLLNLPFAEGWVQGWLRALGGS